MKKLIIVDQIVRLVFQGIKFYLMYLEVSYDVQKAVSAAIVVYVVAIAVIEIAVYRKKYKHIPKNDEDKARSKDSMWLAFSLATGVTYVIRNLDAIYKIFVLQGLVG